LWSFAPFIAYALDQQVKTYILNFGKYQDEFFNVNRFSNITFLRIDERWSVFLDRLCTIVRRMPKFAKTVSPLATWAPGDKLQNNLIPGATSHITLVKSWTAPVPTGLEMKYHQELVELFAPKSLHSSVIKKTFSTARAAFSVVVGLHLRRGDYRTYMKGKYFFSDDEFCQFARQIQNQLPGERVGFLLCSNEPIDKNAYADLSTFSLPDSSGVSDLYALAQCDYILGPPSTYSMWASFYGQKKLQFVYSAKQQVKLSKFNTVTSQNVFADGTTL
jgi:hypothetical protein